MTVILVDVSWRSPSRSESERRALNCTGYAAGWLVGRNFTQGERIAATLSISMRDFAVAATLLVGADFLTAVTLPAVVFGIVEMTTSAGLAQWFSESV